jgi:hypothetical protein
VDREGEWRGMDAMLSDLGLGCSGFDRVGFSSPEQFLAWFGLGPTCWVSDCFFFVRPTVPIQPICITFCPLFLGWKSEKKGEKGSGFG